MYGSEQVLGQSPSWNAMTSMRQWRPAFDNGDGDGDEIDVEKALADPRVQEAVGKLAEAALKEQHAGLIQNRDEFRAEKDKLLERVDELAGALKNFEGLDPEKVRTIMARIDESEEAKLIADGKLDEVVEKRFGRKEAAYQKQIETLQGQVEERNGVATKWQGGYNNLKIETAVNSAADALKLFSHAKPDALAAARTVFSVNDEGEIVALDSEGVVQTSKDGSNPLGIQEWLEGRKENSPHWWPAPQGGGAAGGEVQDSGVTGYTDEQIRQMKPAEYQELRKKGVIK